MKAVKIAGLISLLVAANAMAVAESSTVTWTIGTASPAVMPGAPVDWAASVAVSTTCMGLWSYQFTVEVRDSANGLANVDFNGNVSAPVSSFKVGGVGPATVRDNKAAGGPGFSGMSGSSIDGTFGTIGKLTGVASGMASPFNKTNHVWGVGLAGRKAALLANPEGAFVLHNGNIPTAGLVAGTYTVKLIPEAGATLKITKGTTTTVLNYDTGTFTSMPSTDTVTNVGSMFTFVVVPEPATMVLLAAAGLFIRRRHA